jgi:limonene-1,2-epoxide hydrolase
MFFASRRRLLAGGALLPMTLTLSAAAQVATGKNVELILAFCKAGQDRDLEKQMSFITQDCIYHNMPDEPVVGYKAVRELLSGYITGTGTTEIIVTNIAESANGTVLTERMDRFRMKGKVVDCPVMGAAEIVNGKIKHWRDYYDNAKLFAQTRT